jgi:diguanylate cyclase (GGDEF)-like protein/PAS domain S-box-containing protein
MKLRNNEVIFLVDAEPQDSEDYSAPGDVYDEPSSKLLNIFMDKQAFIEGPITDAWGRWISAHATIFDPVTEKVTAIIGLDVDASRWEKTILFYKVFGASTPLFFTLVVIIFSTALFKTRTVNVRLTLEITERKQAEEALRESEAKYRTIFENIQDVYFETSIDGTILEISPSVEIIYQYNRKELVGKSLSDIYTNPEERDEFLKLILDKGKVSDFEINLTDKDGSQHPCTISTLLIRDEQGNPIKLIGSLRNIRERKQAEEELKRLSYLDGLTGVANRRRFDEDLGLEWRRMTRDAKPLSLIMCDIDFFKAYNDTYGHQGGDDSLRRVANTLNSVVGRPGDLVARYGGEEFVVILPETDSQNAKFLAEKMRSRVESLGIIHVSSQVCEVLTISLGVATSIPTRGSLPDELISSADQALYEAKTEGRNRVNLAK